MAAFILPAEDAPATQGWVWGGAALQDLLQLPDGDLGVQAGSGGLHTGNVLVKSSKFELCVRFVFIF